MSLKMSNNAESTLAATITVGATTISVQTGHGTRFPAVTTASGDWFPVTLEDAAGNLEILRCTDVTGDALTVTRAQEGTSAFAFTAGALVHNRLTVAALQTKADADQVTGKALFTHPTAAPSVGSQFLVVSPASGALVGEEDQLGTYNGGDHTLAGSWSFGAATPQTNYVDPNGTVHTTNSAGVPKAGSLGSADTTHAAAAPAVGSSELVLGVATGAYVGQEGKLATFNGGDQTLAGSYTFTDPVKGTQYIDDAGVIYTVGDGGAVSSNNTGKSLLAHPTGAPNVGFTTYVGSPATGAFAGQENMYATYDGGDHTLLASWSFKAAPAGNTYKASDGSLVGTNSAGAAITVGGGGSLGIFPITSVTASTGAVNDVSGLGITVIYQIEKLSDTLYIGQGRNGSNVQVFAMTLSGDVLTFGTPVNVALFADVGSIGTQLDLERISNTEFIYIARGAGDIVNVGHGSVAGTAITLTAGASPTAQTGTISDCNVLWNTTNNYGVFIYRYNTFTFLRRFTMTGSTIVYPGVESNAHAANHNGRFFPSFFTGTDTILLPNQGTAVNIMDGVNINTVNLTQSVFSQGLTGAIAISATDYVSHQSSSSASIAQRLRITGQVSSRGSFARGFSYGGSGGFNGRTIHKGDVVFGISSSSYNAGIVAIDVSGADNKVIGVPQNISVDTAVNTSLLNSICDADAGGILVADTATGIYRVSVS